MIHHFPTHLVWGIQFCLPVISYLELSKVTKVSILTHPVRAWAMSSNHTVFVNTHNKMM